MFILNGSGRKVLNMLTSLGMTEYEARAYFTLLMCGEARAIRVSRLSGVPQSKIYVALERLECKGLAEVAAYGTPKIFAPKPFEKTVKEFVDYRRRLIGEAMESAHELAQIVSRLKPVMKKHGDRVRIFEPTYRRRG